MFQILMNWRLEAKLRKFQIKQQQEARVWEAGELAQLIEMPMQRRHQLVWQCEEQDQQPEGPKKQVQRIEREAESSKEQS